MASDRVPKYKQKISAAPEKQKEEYPEGDYQLKDHLMPVDSGKEGEKKQQRKNAAAAGSAESKKKAPERAQGQKEKE